MFLLTQLKMSGGYVQMDKFEIPEQLNGLRFNRVRFKEKRAFEVGWQNNPYTFQEIKQYFPKENYGVICGGDIRVLDDDTKNNKLLNKFLENFGETFRVRDHLYFKFDNKHSKKIIFFDEDKNHLGELQGDNTYVVGAGSTHPSGEIYEVKTNKPIITISYDEFIKVFDEFISSYEMNLEKGEVGEDDEEIILEVLDKWKEGDRQNLTLNLTGYLRKEKRFGFKHSQEIIKEICNRAEDKDINERLGAVKETYFKDESEIKGIKGLIEKGIIKENKNIDDFLIIEYFNSGENAGQIKSSKVDIDKVAEYIENELEVRTITGLREESIEVFDEGIWVPKGRGKLKARIEEILGVYSKNNIVSEILEKIKRRTEISREETENIPNHKRCLNNGVLDFEDIDNVKLLPYNKKYNFRTKWKIDYNPKAKPIKYLEVINTALDNDDINKFQEYQGMHLTRLYEIKKFAILHGQKDTSKSVVMNHMTITMNHNVSGLTIQDISRGKPFDLLGLQNKDANLCDDLSSSDMKAVGGIKKSVGNGFIDGEQKFGDKIRFPNTAKQTYACNKIPNPGDDIDDEAYYGRILLFGFDNTTPEEKQDHHLIEKITTPKELSGWLNWAIEGYKRLQRNKKFTNDFTPEENKYLRKLNLILRWEILPF